MAVVFPLQAEELPLREPEDIAREDEAMQRKVSTITPLLFPEIWAAIITMAAPTLSKYRLLCKTSRIIWQHCWLSPSSRAYFLLHKKGPSQAIMFTCLKQNYNFIGPDIGRVLEIMMPRIPEVNCDHDVNLVCPMVIFAGLGTREAAAQCMIALLSHPKKELDPEHIRLALRIAMKNNDPVVFKLLLLGAPPPPPTATTTTTTMTKLAAEAAWLDNPNENDIKLMNDQLLRVQFGLLHVNNLLQESKLAIVELAITHKLPHTLVDRHCFHQVCQMKQPELVVFVCKHNLLESNIDPWSVVFMDDVEAVTCLLDIGITPTPIALIRTVCCPQSMLNGEVHNAFQDMARYAYARKKAVFSEASVHKTFSSLMRSKFEANDFALALAGAVIGGDMAFVEEILAVNGNVNRSIAANIALFKGDYDMCKMLLETSTQSAKYEPLTDTCKPAWPNPKDDTTRFLDQYEVFKTRGVYTEVHLQDSFDSFVGWTRDTKQLDVFLSRTSVNITDGTFWTANFQNKLNVEYLLSRRDKWNMDDSAKMRVLSNIIYNTQWINDDGPFFARLTRTALESGFPVHPNDVGHAAKERVRYGHIVDESWLRMIFEAFSRQNTRDNRLHALNTKIIHNIAESGPRHKVCFVLKLLCESGFEFDSNTLAVLQGRFPNDSQVELAVRELIDRKL